MERKALPQIGTSPPATEMDTSLSEMARGCYGYGRWEAPYWFIGPEQGQARDENNDLGSRLKVWIELGKRELSDCKTFHDLIEQRQWHREKPRLQATWRPLMLLLMKFLERPTDKENLRAYQRDEWGRESGETCVIELSGLAANSSKEPRDRTCCREDRIKVIRERICEHNPVWVVMYGTSQKESWEKVAGCTFPPDSIMLSGTAIFALTPHPVSYGLRNTYWQEVGEKLRRLAGK